MRAEPDDLTALVGRGNEFQAFLFDLVREEARGHGIAPSDIAYDHRVNIGDGGRDIVVRRPHTDPKPRFIPNVPSVWSAKSGADGVKATTLKSEVLDPAHAEIREFLHRGNRYVWCTVHNADQDARRAMLDAAKDLAFRIGCSPNQFEFRWKEDLAAVLNDHPGLIGVHLPAVATGLGATMNLAEWRRYAMGKAPWVGFAERDSLRTAIAAHLLDRGRDNRVHIAGLSGIGKTRTTFEACIADPFLASVLYVPSYEAFASDHGRLLRYLSRPGLHAKVVIDEFPLTRVDAFSEQVAEFGDRLRFVTIGPAPRGAAGARSGDPKLLVLAEPETEAGVLAVLERSAAGVVADPVLRSIAEVSGHDLRLALLLLEATRRDPALRTIPIVNTDDIWQRLMSLFRDHLGDANVFRDHYAVLATALDVGRHERHRPELDYLGGYFARPSVDLDRAIERAGRCGLGTVTTDFFEAGPRALAARVFEAESWPLIRDRLHDFLREMPSERLRLRFVQRCQECGGRVREEVESAMGEVFRAELGEGLTAVRARNPSRLFQAWAEMDPVRGLQWLRDRVRDASLDDLYALDGQPDGSGGWRGRRQIVWLCEHLACFAQYFDDCEEILFRLARAETERSIGNNSTNVWRWMFWPVLSNTEVPFEPRYERLLGRLTEAREAPDVALVISAALGALHGDRSRGAPPRVVGGRIVPPEWRPQTLGDLQRVEVAAGRRLLTVVRTLGPDQRRMASPELIKDLWTLVRLGLVPELRVALAAEVLTDEQARTLRAAVDDAIDQLEDGAEPDEEEVTGA